MMKNFKELIKLIRESSRGNAILFFSFYFLFFIVLIIFLKFNTKRGYTVSNYEKGIPYSFSLNEILKKNYNYYYDVILDDEKNTYIGQKDGKKQKFSFKDEEYYFDGKQFFINDNELKQVENPFLFYDLLIEKNLSTLIQAGSYESQTSYESGRHVYTFLLSSNTVNQLIYGISSDFFEEPNKVIVGVNEKNSVEDIRLEFNSYCKVNSLCEKSLEIKLSYYDFGKATIN